MVYKQLVWLVVFGMLFSLAVAIPTPKGVDGVIYELDGITQVPKGVSFSVENLANKFKVEGQTGHGSPGRYSVSLPGDDGDQIVIRAWNQYNSANLTLTLNGVMRGVNFLLNMSVPTFPVDNATLAITTPQESITLDEHSPSLFVGFANETATPQEEEDFIAQLTEENIYVEEQDVSVQELNSKPSEIPSPDNAVYKYVEITKNTSEITRSLIGFKVAKSWLTTNNVTKEDVSLRRFVEGVWVYLPTTIVEEDETFVYYAAYTPGFSFFAITLKQGVRAVFPFNPSLKVFSQPYTAFGEVKSTFGKLLDGVNVFIQNQETGEGVHAITGLQSPPGVYAGTVQGKKGDVIRIVAGEKTAFITVGDDNLIRTDFSLKGEITGSVLGNFGIGGVPMLGVFLLALAFFALIAVRIKYQKSGK